MLFWFLGGVVVVAGSWSVRRVKSEFDSSGTLSMLTVVVVWCVYLAHAALTACAAWFSLWPLPISPPFAIACGAALLVVGASLLGAALRQFGSIRRTSGRKEDALITGGVYCYSRNPQNIGWGLALLGIGLLGASGMSLLLAALFWLCFRLYLPVEEKHLTRIFGSEYVCYCRRTPRYVGMPQDNSP